MTTLLTWFTLILLYVCTIAALRIYLGKKFRVIVNGEEIALYSSRTTPKLKNNSDCMKDEQAAAGSASAYYADSSFVRLRQSFVSPLLTKPLTSVKRKWSPCPSREFLVRGPDYVSGDRVKKRSMPSFYTCVGVELVKSTSVVSRIRDKVTDASCAWLKEFKIADELKLPRLLIFNAQLPYSPPPLFVPQDKSEDPGFSVVSYHVPHVAHLESLKASKVPGLDLLRELVSSQKSAKGGAALKVIGQIPDESLSELGLPDFFGKYNGRPALVTNSATVAWDSEKSVLEVDYDVRMWSFAARKALSSFHSKLVNVPISLGYLIEGRTKEELPEQILSCFRLDGLDIINDPVSV